LVIGEELDYKYKFDSQRWVREKHSSRLRHSRRMMEKGTLGQDVKYALKDSRAHRDYYQVLKASKSCGRSPRYRAEIT
jgi:hypothetical protein